MNNTNPIYLIEGPVSYKKALRELNKGSDFTELTSNGLEMLKQRIAVHKAGRQASKKIAKGLKKEGEALKTKAIKHTNSQQYKDDMKKLSKFI